jgi:hypothetical protein
VSVIDRAGHFRGVDNRDGLLFSTRFGYMFQSLATHDGSVVMPTETIVQQLDALAIAMTQPDDSDARDSDIPAIHTYLGQFIDHDVTARTDREIPDVTEIDRPGHPMLERRDPLRVAEELRNGRRAKLDLDSVYGGGPGLAPGSTSQAQVRDFAWYRGPKGVGPVARTEGLYDADFRLHVFRGKTASGAPQVDLPRQRRFPHFGRAVVADQRNDENVIIAQLHAAFLAFHNAIQDSQPLGPDASPAESFVRTQQLVRWAYQYIVLNDYLPAVCDRAVARSVLASGPVHLGAFADDPGVFIPLEFAVAGFRFGHSMIRPRYRLRGGEQPVEALLFPKPEVHFDHRGQLRDAFVVDWEDFVGPRAQRARRIDPRISNGLGRLPNETRRVLKNLAIRNLRRSFNLSLPTGQAIARRMGFHPLVYTELFPEGDDPQSRAIIDALCSLGPNGSWVPHRNPPFPDAQPLWRATPLWYYALREAELQQDGLRLGEVGSRLVAETLVHLVQRDPSSYLNAKDPAICPDGIEVRVRGRRRRIRSIQDMLRVAAVLPETSEPWMWRIRERLRGLRCG